MSLEMKSCYIGIAVGVRNLFQEVCLKTVSARRLGFILLGQLEFSINEGEYS